MGLHHEPSIHFAGFLRSGRNGRRSGPTHPVIRRRVFAVGRYARVQLLGQWVHALTNPVPLSGECELELVNRGRRIGEMRGGSG